MAPGGDIKGVRYNFLFISQKLYLTPFHCLVTVHGGRLFRLGFRSVRLWHHDADSFAAITDLGGLAW